MIFKQVIGRSFLMVKPILLVVHPIHLDFPIFRYNLNRFKDYFASYWIALSNHYQEVDYTNFLMKEIPDAHFVNVKHTGHDWRNDAINETLDQIKTDEPICFIEQDFLIKDASFFEKVFKDDYKFLYFMEGERVHPAFAVVRREEIEKTSRDFAAYPQGDHFAKFFDELSSGISIDELGVKAKEDYYHMNGLSQNYVSFKYDEPFHHPNNFLYFNYKSINLPIERHPQFAQLEKAIDLKYGHPERHSFLDKFFPS